MLDNKNIFLYPFSLIYGFITGVRNFLYNTGILSSVEFDQPVISVGNISVGGTGKTPHTEYLVNLLQKDFNVATLSRGYKRTTRNFRIASSSSHVSDIGDEPLQLKRKFRNILVAVDRKRVRGTKNILEKYPETEVIILDDAFQHRSITPGFSILLSEFGKLMVRDHMMPYGSLRESITNMRRADIILITKSPEDINPIQRRIIVKEVDKAPYQNLYFTSLIYKNPIAVFESEDPGRKQLEISDCSNCSIVLVTGIANPLPLEKYLRNYVDEIIKIPFPDHHNFNEKDILSITTAYNNIEAKNKYLITTEKDAVRLREFTNITESIKSAFYYIPVGIHFLNDDKDEFDNIIVNYVRKNKRNNRVSEI